MNLNVWKQEFENKKILLWGFGREGSSSYSLIRLVCPGQKIDICDSRRQGEQGLERIRSKTENTCVMFEDEADFSSYDMILKSPGIVIPEGTDRHNITQEAELFLRHYGKQTIGITGTKGKSTTTSMMHAVLSEKYHSHLVGNIGIPCFDAVRDAGDDDLFAFEISCHQLEYGRYSPHIAVFLNLYEEHLDHYGSFRKYGDAKANIFRNQKEDDICIISGDLKEYASEIPDPILIGRDITAEDRVLHIPGHDLQVENCALIGSHNYLNMAVVYQIAQYYGISDSQFLHAMSLFSPLHHRLEDLGTVNGIRYVNDSISTIGQSCIKAIEALDNVGTVLIGGMDRGISYTELEDYLYSHREYRIIFMYATGRRIYEEMRNRQMLHDSLYIVQDLREAVHLARQLTEKGKICLLSPAASSYDHFKNFEERGEVFERLVKEI